MTITMIPTVKTPRNRSRERAQSARRKINTSLGRCLMREEESRLNSHRMGGSIRHRLRHRLGQRLMLNRITVWKDEIVGRGPRYNRSEARWEQ